MGRLGREVMAVVVALVAAFAVIAITEMMNSYLLMPPSSEVLNDPARLREFMASLPTMAYIIVLIGYFLGSFAGGYIVTKMSLREGAGMPLALLIGGLLTLAGLLNFFFLPGQPFWFIGLSLLIFIPITLLGHKLAK